MSLSLTYSLRNIKMNYDRALFGMKLGDCKALARALEHSETLVRLQVWWGLALDLVLLSDCRMVELIETGLPRQFLSRVGSNIPTAGRSQSVSSCLWKRCPLAPKKLA